MTYVLFTDQTARRQVLRAAGRDGRELFYAATFECAAVDDGAGGDGYLPALLVKDAAYLAEVNAKRVAPRLVELGLWHDAETAKGCAECTGRPEGVRPLGEADYFLHEWWVHLLPAEGKKNELARWRERRRKALNADANLKAAVRLRDQDRCRYCDKAVMFGTPDRKSERVGEFDHVDPWCRDGRGEYGNTIGNVVVACKPCNGRKRDRTPEEAGMALRPPPDNPADSRIAAGSQPGSEGPESGRGSGSASRDARDGNGPDRSRISAGSAPGRAGRGPGPFDDEGAAA